MGKGDRRTAKPAGSAKAAELLGAGLGTVGFGGFLGSQALGNVATGFASTAQGSGASAEAPEPAISGEVDGEVAQHLRRLSKRDPTTKLKALQALTALLKDKGGEVETALPSWAYMFARLVMDNNRTVRSEAAAVMGTMAMAVGRKLAPYLKAVMGPWWLANFDPSSDVAEAAQAALQQVFPGCKQKQALLQCRNEVLTFMEDNITSSPETLGDARKESADELADRHERVVSASLLAISSLVDLAAAGANPAQQDTSSEDAERELIQRVAEMIGAPGFYKRYLGSKSALVRRAAYMLVIHLSTRSPQLLDATKRQSAPHILGAFGDKAAEDHGVMWEMVLTYLKAFPGAWEAVDARKVVLPRLWAFLRHACFGSGSISFPALLPLVTLMPKALLGPKPQVFRDLLDSVWSGWEGCAGQARAAAAVCFQEHLCYAVAGAVSLLDNNQDAAVRYCTDLLEGPFGGRVVDAALQAASPAAAEAAAAVITGTAETLHQQASMSRWQVELLLLHVGRAVSQVVTAQLKAPQEVTFQRIAALVKDLALTCDRDTRPLVAQLVAEPVASAIVPAVQACAAPAAASTLLAALIQQFGPSIADGPYPSTEQQGQPTTADVAAGSDHQFSLEKLAQQSLTGPLHSSVAAANANLMLACLQQPSSKWGPLVANLAALHDEGLSDEELLERREKGLQLVLVLIEQLLAQGNQVDLSTWRCSELDALGVQLVTADWLAEYHAAPALAGLLMQGSGDQSLLAGSVLSDVLAALHGHLQSQLNAPGVRNNLLSSIFKMTWPGTSNALYASHNEEPDSDSDQADTGPDIDALTLTDQTNDGAEDNTPEGQVTAAAEGVWRQGKCLAAMLQNLSPEAASSLQLDLRNTLADAARCGVSAAHEGNGWAVQWAVRCQELSSALKDAAQTDLMIDELLAPREGWPHYTCPAQADDSSKQCSTQTTCTASLAEALCQVLGYDTVLQASSRGWLAAELLCAAEASPDAGPFKFHLLHFMADIDDSTSNKGDLALDVLERCLSGAMASSSTGQEPQLHLTALCSLLEALVQGTAQPFEAAQSFFRRSSTKSIEAVSPALLLRVLPVVTMPFRRRSAYEASGLSGLTTAWLAAAAALPPITIAVQEQRQELPAVFEALQVVVSCFPGEESAPTVGMCSAEEQRGLLQLLRRLLAGKKAAGRAAAAERRLSAPPAAGHELGASSAWAEAEALLIQIATCTVIYCAADLQAEDWDDIFALLQAGLGRGSVLLEEVAEEVSAAAVAAFGDILGPEGGDRSAEVALQVLHRLRRLSLPGPERAGRAVAHALQEHGRLDVLRLMPQASAQLLAVLLGVFQAAAAPSGWPAARQAALSDALRMFFAVGSTQAICQAAGDASALEVARWRTGAAQLLNATSQAVLAGLDDVVLAPAVKAAGAWSEDIGVDGVAAALALLGAEQPHAGLQAAALQMLLTPLLLLRLTTAPGIEEDDDLGEQDGETGGDAVTVLERAGVRPLLAAMLPAADAPQGRCLQAWALLLAHMLHLAPVSPGRRRLAQSLRDAQGMVPGLLGLLMQLLPLPPAGGTPGSAKRGRQAATAEPDSTSLQGSDWDFCKELRSIGLRHRKEEDPEEEEEVRQRRLAVAAYRAALQSLPASVRLWFGDLRDRGQAAAVEQYTVARESPLLIRQQLDVVQSPAAQEVTSADNFRVRANAVSREVVAVLEVEEGSNLELVVRLPTAWPLKPADVECRRRVGVTEGRLRKWLLSISAFLRNQNGSILDAIALWKRNVDKEFEGVEECLICYSVVHATTGQLPGLVCRTCTKKFHGGCLYKWFRSAGKSNCPHCQSPW